VADWSRSAARACLSRPWPSKTTIWRVMTDADAWAFDVAVGTWLMRPAGFATPATAGRDAATSVIAAQAEVGKKTNEVPMAAVVPGQIDLERQDRDCGRAAFGEGHRESHP
jgi:hypothetical protein